MIRCIKYTGQDIEEFATIARRRLMADEQLAIEAQPGDATRYYFTIVLADVPAYGPMPTYILSYISDNGCVCMSLGQGFFLVPSYLTEKCPGVNPHTACLLCEMTNRIFDIQGNSMFNFDPKLGRIGPTEAGYRSLFPKQS